MSSPSLQAPPDPDVARLLPRDVDLARPARHPSARPVWLGMVWSRLGRADLAWAFWDRVGAHEVQAWLAAERGRVLREFGLHDQAERLEWRALAAAADPVDAAMLRISLTADAVGRGDVETARRRHAAAISAVAALDDSARAARQRLRLSWVATEVAWLEGRTPDGAGLPRPASDGHVVWPSRDHDHGSDFHRAKALLFGGLVAGSVPMLDAAAALAPPALAWAVHLARADHGVADAAASAQAAWRQVVPPPPFAAAVAVTATAQRLAAVQSGRR